MTEELTLQQRQALAMAQARQRMAQQKGQVQEKPPLTKTVFDQGLQGATFGFADEITDRLGAAGAALWPEALGGTDIPYGDLLSEARAGTKEELEEQMSERPVASILSQLGGGLVTSGIGATTKAGQALANSYRAGNAGSRIVQGGLTGAAAGGAYGAGAAEDGNRPEGAGYGALAGGLLGGAAPAVGAAYSGAKGLLAPAIDDSTKILAQRAIDDFGIPLRASEVSDSVPVKITAGITDKLPFSGSNAFKDTQSTAFHKQLAKTIGQDADDLGPETFKNFYKENSRKFDSALKDEVFEIDRDLLGKLDEITLDADETIAEDLAKVVRKNVQNLIKEVGPDGAISGEKFASFRSQLLKRQQRAEGGAREYLGDIVDFIDDSIEQLLPEDKTKVLKKARREYRNAKTLQPLLEKSTDGRITPSDLMNRVAANKYITASKSTVGEDDLIDLARIGKKFLKEQSRSSGTAENLMYGLSPAAIFNPLLAAQIGGGLALGRGASALNRNQAVVQKMLNAPKKGILNLPNKPASAGLLGGYLSQ